MSFTRRLRYRTAGVSFHFEAKSIMMENGSVPGNTLLAAKPGSSLYVWAASIAGALGGFLFGYDWVVIGGAKPFYERFFHLDAPLIQGWAMSCALIGCLFGALLSGRLADRFGRRPTLMLAAALFLISSLGTAAAQTLAAFVVWRIGGGLAIGLASSLSPMYIAEIAPAQQRGKLVSFNQLTLVVGILCAQLVNWKIARPVPANATAMEIFLSWNGQHGWRWMFGVTAVPALLFLVGAVLLPESPRWLAQKGELSSARRILTRVGGEDYAAKTLMDIATQAEGTPKDQSGLRYWSMRKVLMLGLGLAILQQWCGINIIFNYAQEIFSAAGYQVSDILLNIVITGVTNLLFTVVALFTVDRFGRRALMLTGLGGLLVIYLTLGFFYHRHSHGLHMLLLVLAAIACYAMSLAPITWVVISEIFPNRVRGFAMSISIATLWIACFLLTLTFPFLNRALGVSGTLWIYAGVCATGFFYLYYCLPETKGMSLEEIENVWDLPTAASNKAPLSDDVPVHP
jgi:sugar porter (SP) family MFS transporter